jgi:hypothetical protein
MHVKSPNNTSKWQMRFNSALKGLNITTEQLFVLKLQSAKFKFGKNFMPFHSFFCGFKTLLREVVV